jgi:hypothetical protein
MTSNPPVPTDDPALPALAAEELDAARPVRRQVAIGLLPLALIVVIVLLFVVAAWTLLAAGS